MIQKLRIRLIAMAMAAQLILLIVIVAFSNYLSYLKLADSADFVIDELMKDPYDPEPQTEETLELETSPSPSPSPSPSSPPEPSATEEPEPSPSPVVSEAPEDQAAPPFTDRWDPWAPEGENSYDQWADWMHPKGPHPPQWGSGTPYDDIRGAEETAEPSPSPTPTPTPEPTTTPEPTPEPWTQRRPEELPFSSRYFIVSQDTEGKLLYRNMDHIISISEDEAMQMAGMALSTPEEKGFCGNFRYRAYFEEGQITLLFLDCSQDLETFRTTLIANCVLSLVGLVCTFLLLMLFSGRIVRPVAESYDKQKQFISAAGHELRTPLTIIGADTEVLSMELGENEWLSDISHQTARMTELTNSLLQLSRMDEGRQPMTMLEFPLSDLVEETLHSFDILAKKQNLRLTADIAPMVSVRGDITSLRQLVSILMDNAIKYSLGTIDVSLRQTESTVCLEVSNSSAPVTPEQLSQFFDRFYRTEASRNSETGGYGLGLAIAQSIVQAHRGKITASSPEEGIVRLTVVLPKY